MVTFVAGLKGGLDVLLNWLNWLFLLVDKEFCLLNVVKPQILLHTYMHAYCSCANLLPTVRLLWRFQAHALVRRFPDPRGVGAERQAVLLVMVTSMRAIFQLREKLLATFSFIGIKVCLFPAEWAQSWCFWSLVSVPDLSEYRVWLGVSDIREGAADLLKKQEVSISQVICGPEGSSLVLLRLAQWVLLNFTPKKNTKTF